MSLRFQDDCRALKVVLHRLSELHGTNIGQLLAPFTFSVDLGATHAHMAELCKNNDACASVTTIPNQTLISKKMDSCFNEMSRFTISQSSSSIAQFRPPNLTRP